MDLVSDRVGVESSRGLIPSSSGSVHESFYFSAWYIDDELIDLCVSSYLR